MLSEEQQRFLIRYINNKGDFYGTVESMGLDIAHITNWRQVSKQFDREYTEAKRSVIEFIKDENYITALRKLNDVLLNGVTQSQVVQKHIIADDDNREDGEGVAKKSAFEVTRTSKHLGVPGYAIKMALEESSILKAVQTLVNEGVIPAEIARNITGAANRISDEISKSFGVSKDSDYANDKKAIALIRAAVLGEVDV